MEKVTHWVDNITRYFKWKFAEEEKSCNVHPMYNSLGWNSIYIYSSIVKVGDSLDIHCMTNIVVKLYLSRIRKTYIF